MVDSKEKEKDFFFLTFLNSIGKNRHGIGKKGGYFRLGMGRKSPDNDDDDYDNDDD